MAYELRDNSGSLFLNGKKEKETHPDRTGTAMIDGVTYYVSGWLKKSQGGQQFLSLAFKRKEEKSEAVSTGRHSYSPGGKVTREDPISTGRGDMSDDIPFAPEFR